MYQPGGGLRTEFKGPSLNTCGRGHRKTRTPWLLWKRYGGWCEIARDCALYLLPSFLSFLLSFFSVFVSLIIRRLVSIALFERMDDVDGWTDDARWRENGLFSDCLSGMLFISNVVQFRYWFDVDLTFKFYVIYGGESNGAIMRMKFTFSRGNSSFVLQAKRVILFRSFHIRGRILSFGQQRRY